MALSKFQQAFKDARASGETEFEFNGKKYNTKYKEESEVSSKPARSAPAAKTNENYGNEGRRAKAPTPKATNAPKSEPYKHKMPITSFFEGIRERGKKDLEEREFKHGGKVKMASGGSASKRADGIAQKGKTRGKMC
jgi:hypothetical protein